jgi:hypothetical protein
LDKVVEEIQIPSTKHQVPNKFEIPMFETAGVPCLGDDRIVTDNRSAVFDYLEAPKRTPETKPLETQAQMHPPFGSLEFEICLVLGA